MYSLFVFSYLDIPISTSIWGSFPKSLRALHLNIPVPHAHALAEGIKHSYGNTVLPAGQNQPSVYYHGGSFGSVLARATPWFRRIWSSLPSWFNTGSQIYKQGRQVYDTGRNFKRAWDENAPGDAEVMKGAGYRRHGAIRARYAWYVFFVLNAEVLLLLNDALFLFKINHV